MDFRSENLQKPKISMEFQGGGLQKPGNLQNFIEKGTFSKTQSCMLRDWQLGKAVVH